MPAALLHSSLSGLGAQLRLGRQDITFRNLTPECVGIEVILHNEGDEVSPLTVAHLSVAPLGAFVPWRSLVTLAVPPLRPGQTTVLTATALRPRPAPLGPPDSVPPRRVLTALGAAADFPHRDAVAFCSPLNGPVMEGQDVAREVALKRQIVEPARVPRLDLVGVVRALGLTLDYASFDQICGQVQTISRDHGLTPYDALYIELALRRGCQLATLDDAQRRAAEAVGLQCL